MINSVPEDPDLSQAERIDQVCTAFEAAWKAGAVPRLEDWLGDLLGAERLALLQELLLVEVHYHRRRGAAVGAAAYRRRFPELAESWLQEVIPPSQETAAETGHATPGPGAGAAGPVPEMVRCASTYELGEELGHGGMGVVYRGHDAELNRTLAVKVLLAKHRDNEELKRRFLEEAQIMGQLQHPGVAPIHESGRLADGRPFFSMKQVKGQTLTELLKEGPRTTDEGRSQPLSAERRGESPPLGIADRTVRRSPADLPRLLAIFEQVCQTVAFAHSRGILHRDLKPGNVMVGTFGEVQLMDWGLAKVLSTAGGERPPPDPVTQDASTIFTVRTGSPDGSDTAAGRVLGTPAYMAPEQARGEIEKLDERADVFGLGAILCEILTGQPPFPGDSQLDSHRKATKGDLQETLTRLDRGGADAELVHLARRCLAAAKDDRPRHAGQVAEAMAQYQDGVRERLRRAEVERAEAQVRAAEERKRREVERQRRRATLAAAVAGLLLVVGAAGAGLWYQYDRAERAAAEAEAVRKQQQATREARLALTTARDRRGDLQRNLRQQGGVFELLNKPAQWQGQLQAAQSALRQALAQNAGGLPDGSLGPEIAELDELLRLDERDYQLAVALEKIRMDKAGFVVHGTFDWGAALTRYGDTFARAGLPAPEGDSAALAERIKQSPIRDSLLAALDDWALAASHRQDGLELARRLLVVAGRVDADPWRSRLPDVNVWWDGKTVEQKIGGWARSILDQRDRRRSPQMWVMIGVMLPGRAGEEWLRRGQAEYPADFWLNLQLGHVLVESKPAEAAGFSRAALAVRPDAAVAYNNLGFALYRQKDLDGAAAYFTRALNKAPKYPQALVNLAAVLEKKGDLEGAFARYGEAVRLNPRHAEAHNGLGMVLHAKKNLIGAIREYDLAIKLGPENAWPHNNRGNALSDQGDLAGAIQEYLQAIALDPRLAATHHNLGLALAAKGDQEGAIDHFRKALQIDPEFVESYYSLGNTLSAKGDREGAMQLYRKVLEFNPQAAGAHNNLGAILHEQGNRKGAIVHYREAVKFKPGNANYWFNLGGALREEHQFPEAVRALRRAVTLDPSMVTAWDQLGLALQHQNDLPGAVECYEKALKLDNTLAKTWFKLATALHAQKDLEGAEAKLRKALALDPQLGPAHAGLGAILLEQGEFAQAQQATRRALQLLSSEHLMYADGQQQLQLCERLLKIEQRAAALVQGQAQPAGAAELLKLARFCRQYRHYAVAARLHALALAADPTPVKDLAQSQQYQAACAAALAAAGKGKGLLSDQLTATDKARLRQQALDWLRADLKPLSQTVTAYVERDKAGGQPPTSPLEKLSGQSSKPGPADLLRVRDRLLRWRTDPDLASLREDKEPAKLPAQQQKDWRQFWDQVRALEKQAVGCFTEQRLSGSRIGQHKEPVHEVHCQAGQTYAFDLESTAFDPVLRLYDGQGNKLAENDDVEPGVNRNSRLVFTPEKGGTYRLVVTSFLGQGAGPYTLIIREFAGKK